MIRDSEFSPAFLRYGTQPSLSSRLRAQGLARRILPRGARSDGSFRRKGESQASGLEIIQIRSRAGGALNLTIRFVRTWMTRRWYCWHCTLPGIEMTRDYTIALFAGF